jgi:hypothetical protein
MGQSLAKALGRRLKTIFYYNGFMRVSGAFKVKRKKIEKTVTNAKKEREFLAMSNVAFGKKNRKKERERV